MIYRPKITFTEMCIYIDNHKYDKDVDKEQIYKYLYYLAYSTAKRNGYFHTGNLYKEETYDDFALWFATELFLRLYNDRLGEIKSIKNYINNISYLRKLRFNDNYGNYQQSFIADNNFLRNYYRDSLTQDNKTKVRELIYNELNNLSTYILDYVKDTPYRDNKIISKNIYLSCLLSILDSITLSNNEKLRLEKKLKSNEMINLSKEEIVLYQLPFDMKPIVQLINRKAKNKLLKNLKDILSVDTQTEYELDKSLLDIYGDWDAQEREEMDI